MAVAPALTQSDLDALRKFDTCIVANAIDTFGVRLSNTGFTDARIHCMFEDAPPMVGYAITARMRSGEPPIVGRNFRDRDDLWKAILKIPTPRVLVLEDIEDPPGHGAFVGEMHAAILKALGCIGYVTNGAVRELPVVHAMGFQLFAGSVVASRAYSHIFEIGSPVVVASVEVETGNLLHGDRHGVLTIPLEIAAKVPEVANRLQQAERKVIDFCRSKEFSIEKLREVMKGLD
jgi:4-hydroxy-4-methyl-2-oxoglutarate aldolase